MKISLLQENFAKGLTLASKIVANKTNLPILTNILFSPEEGKLKLTATNLEIGINIWLPAKKEKAGQFAMPAKDITEFVASLPPGKVVLEEKKGKIKVASGKYQAVFNGVSPADFPQVFSLKSESAEDKIVKAVKIDKSKFLKAASKVCFAAAVDETRPVLTGVRINTDEKKLQMVATDGYRLSLKTIKLEKEANLPLMIIPSQALMEVARVAEGDEKEKIKLALTKESNQVLFSFGEIEVVARLIEGEFPDFEKIIPEQGENQAEVDREELGAAVKAAAIFARKSANIIKCQFAEEKLVIKANAPELGGNETSLSSKYQGEEMEVAFNYRFLQEFLRNANKETVSIKLNSPLKPGVFKEKGDPSYLHIIMPVRVQE